MQCHICKVDFAYSTDLSVHQDVHHKYFTCLICNKGFGPGGHQPRTDRDAHFVKHGKQERKNALIKQSKAIKNNMINKKIKK